AKVAYTEEVKSPLEEQLTQPIPSTVAPAGLVERKPTPNIRMRAPHQEALGPEIDWSPIHESVMDKARDILVEMKDKKAAVARLMKEVLDEQVGSKLTT